MKFDIRKNRAYNRQLRNVVQNLFTLSEAEGISDHQLALAAHLSPQTVWNLRNGITRLPRYSTIYQLAVALGVENNFVPTGE